ncbi:multidrug transporter emrE, partial [Escherichia coli 96.0932]
FKRLQYGGSYLYMGRFC